MTKLFAENSCRMQTASVLKPFSEFWNSFKTSEAVRRWRTSSNSAWTAPATFIISQNKKTLKSQRENSETQVFWLSIFISWATRQMQPTLQWPIYTLQHVNHVFGSTQKGTGSVDKAQKATCKVTPAVLGSRAPNPVNWWTASPHKLQYY